MRGARRATPCTPCRSIETDRIAPVDQLRRVLGEWVAEVAASGNLVVLRTPPGCAHVVASALDRSGLDGLLGTVAGDDTLMCVADRAVDGTALADRLRDLAGVDWRPGRIDRLGPTPRRRERHAATGRTLWHGRFAGGAGRRR